MKSIEKIESRTPFILFNDIRLQGILNKVQNKENLSEQEFLLFKNAFVKEQDTNTKRNYSLLLKDLAFRESHLFISSETTTELEQFLVDNDQVISQNIIDCFDSIHYKLKVTNNTVTYLTKAFYLEDRKDKVANFLASLIIHKPILNFPKELIRDLSDHLILSVNTPNLDTIDQVIFPALNFIINRYGKEFIDPKTLSKSIQNTFKNPRSNNFLMKIKQFITKLINQGIEVDQGILQDIGKAIKSFGAVVRIESILLVLSEYNNPDGRKKTNQLETFEKIILLAENVLDKFMQQLDAKQLSNVIQGLSQLIRRKVNIPENLCYKLEKAAAVNANLDSQKDLAFILSQIILTQKYILKRDSTFSVFANTLLAAESPKSTVIQQYICQSLENLTIQGQDLNKHEEIINALAFILSSRLEELGEPLMIRAARVFAFLSKKFSVPNKLIASSLENFPSQNQKLTQLILTGIKHAINKGGVSLSKDALPKFTSIAVNPENNLSDRVNALEIIKFFIKGGQKIGNIDSLSQIFQEFGYIDEGFTKDLIKLFQLACENNIQFSHTTYETIENLAFKENPPRMELLSLLALFSKQNYCPSERLIEYFQSEDSLTDFASLKPLNQFLQNGLVISEDILLFLLNLSTHSEELQLRCEASHCLANAITNADESLKEKIYESLLVNLQSSNYNLQEALLIGLSNYITKFGPIYEEELEIKLIELIANHDSAIALLTKLAHTEKVFFNQSLNYLSKISFDNQDFLKLLTIKRLIKLYLMKLKSFWS